MLRKLNKLNRNRVCTEPRCRLLSSVCTLPPLRCSNILICCPPVFFLLLNTLLRHQTGYIFCYLLAGDTINYTHLTQPSCHIRTLPPHHKILRPTRRPPPRTAHHVSTIPLPDARRRPTSPLLVLCAAYQHFHRTTHVVVLLPHLLVVLHSTYDYSHRTMHVFVLLPHLLLVNNDCA